MASRKLIIAMLFLLLALPLLRADNPPAAPPPSPDQASDVDRLKRENKELKEKVDQYKALEEDLAAQRVFEKAKSQMIVWLTFGGISIVIAGVVGYKALLEYLKSMVNKKLDAVTAAEINAMLAKESHQQVQEFVPNMIQQAQTQMVAIVQEQKTAIIALAQDQIARMVTSGPIGPKTEAAISAPAKMATVDYTSEMSAVKDQGPEGSTVGMSLAYALEYQIKKSLHQTVEISPRFIYYYARKASGMDTHSDTGATLSEAVKMLATKGAVTEEAWPYKGGEFAADPPDSVKHAKHYKIKKSFRLKNVEGIKSALEEYGPVVAGIAVYDSFMSPEVAKTGMAKLPLPSEQVMGGHSVCLVGYDDAKQTFKFINSWGPSWGDHGYGFLPFKYLEGSGSEVWAITM